MQAKDLTVHGKASLLVEREVLLCLSSLVDDLVKVYHRAMNSTPRDNFGYQTKREPLPWDYEDEILMLHREVESTNSDDETDTHEIFEHWAVTNYLAKKLEEKGERVVDMSNLKIWCRTTTGQQIAADGVIEEIATEVFS